MTKFLGRIWPVNIEALTKSKESVVALFNRLRDLKLGELLKEGNNAVLLRTVMQDQSFSLVHNVNGSSQRNVLPA